MDSIGGKDVEVHIHVSHLGIVRHSDDMRFQICVSRKPLFEDMACRVPRQLFSSDIQCVCGVCVCIITVCCGFNLVRYVLMQTEMTTGWTSCSTAGTNSGVLP